MQSPAGGSACSPVHMKVLDRGGAGVLSGKGTGKGTCVGESRPVVSEATASAPELRATPLNPGFNASAGTLRSAAYGVSASRLKADEAALYLHQVGRKAVLLVAVEVERVLPGAPRPRRLKRSLCNAGRHAAGRGICGGACSALVSPTVQVCA